MTEGRAANLRRALFQMRDAREVTSAAGFTLTTEAKAKLYDIQQDIIRAAIAVDDRAIEAACSALREGQGGMEHESDSLPVGTPSSGTR